MPSKASHSQTPIPFFSFLLISPLIDPRSNVKNLFRLFLSNPMFFQLFQIGIIPIKTPDF